MGFIEINSDFGSQTQNLIFFILSISLVWFLLIVYSFKTLGLKKTIRYFLPMMIVGLFIESGGVATGNYYYPGYFFYINVLGGAVPLVIILGWSANLFLFINMAKIFVKEVFKKQNKIQLVLISLIASVFAILLDLLQDPLAHHNHWWVWTKEVSLGVTFYDVPLWNFRGWFILIFFMTLTTLLIDKSGLSENRKLIISLSSTALIGGIILLIRVIMTNIGL